MPTAITSQVATTDFLELLTVQLKNQDPINPVQQEDFISQLAQFSQLENSEELNASFASLLKLQQISQGIDLVGKEVTYLDPSSSQLQTGAVDEFFVDQGNIQLMINGQSISVDLISGVRAATPGTNA